MAIALHEKRPDTVVIDGGSVIIHELVDDDPELVTIVKESDDPERAVRLCLTTGARAIKGTQVSIDTAVVEARFAEFEHKLVDGAAAAVSQITRTSKEYLDPETGQLRKMVDTVVGEVEMAMGKRFDPASKESVFAKIEELVSAKTDDQAKVVRDLVDPGNPESPLGRLRLEVKSDLKEVRDALSRLHSDNAVEQARAEAMELTAIKGLSFQEVVFEAVCEFAALYGDHPEDVNKTPGMIGGLVGDQTVLLNQDDTPGQALSYVVEVKDKKLSLKEALAELDESMQNRGSDAAVMVFSRQQLAPVRAPYAQFGNRAIAVLEKETADELALRVALAASRCLLLRNLNGTTAEADIDGALTLIDKAREALKTEATIKRFLTGSQKQAGEAAGHVRKLVGEVETILAELAARLGR